MHGVRLKPSSPPSTGTDKNGSFLLLASDQDSVHFLSSLTPSRELEETKLLVLINTVLPRDAQWGISEVKQTEVSRLNPLKPELNPICNLLALLGAHHFLHVSRIRVKSLTFRRLMSYTYGALILYVSRSHTTTQHSR